jgi:flagellar transcriptional activator FlhD
MVNSSETVNDISNLNLSYLLLAQRMFKEDPATAMYRLGMSRELADLLGKLTLAQIVKISASNLLL